MILTIKRIQCDLCYKQETVAGYNETDAQVRVQIERWGWRRKKIKTGTHHHRKLNDVCPKCATQKKESVSYEATAV